MTYDELRQAHPEYFDPAYLHRWMVEYAKGKAKLSKRPVWAVLKDMLASGSTVASVIAAKYDGDD